MIPAILLEKVYYEQQTYGEIAQLFQNEALLTHKLRI